MPDLTEQVLKPREVLAVIPSAVDPPSGERTGTRGATVKPDVTRAAALCRLSCWFVSSGANARWAQVGGALRKYSAHVGAEAPSRRPGVARSHRRPGATCPPSRRVPR